MKVRSVLGLKPSDLRNGVIFEQISSYLSYQRLVAMTNSPRLVPFDSRVVHLVHDDNELVDAVVLDQDRMFSCLPLPLEPSFKLSFPRRQHLTMGRVRTRVEFRGTRDLLAWQRLPEQPR